MDIKKGKDNRFKHLDFTLADIIIAECSYFIAVLLYRAYRGGYFLPSSLVFHRQIIIILFTLFVSLTIERPYKGILKRNKWKELRCTLQHTAFLAIADIVCMYFIHESSNMSRVTFGFTWVVYFFLQLIFRYVWKRVLRKRIRRKNERNYSYVLICKEEDAHETIEQLAANYFNRYLLVGVFYVDYIENVHKGQKIDGLPIMGGVQEMMDYATHDWVDSVIINIPGQKELSEELEQHFSDMGITTHHVLFTLNNEENNGKNVFVSKYGNLLVTTYEERDIPGYQYFFKRVLDIIGGIVGSFFTIIIFIIIGPQIYIKSPGPIIFKQERVGKNGKTFTMYKFRSMYMDAEERKAALMEQNKMNGLMFKMDDDPRIIGSEKKDKDGNPKGIGNFIRKTSLDEFPQFFNVLKGDMSLVGTRPPTMDEWKQYSEHHRKRLAIKPGITGMWQISGRSDITDFEEIVRLDSQYVDNWTVQMDIKILAITVKQVLQHKGAE